ncbi:hypothetical protein SARC_08473 [Sphaeroforma arctica JP610]|uniref:Uncharacterized protein n=1 Tax=Sphaeroforma arctica JP610 TaxID=667725 RepID=A0A0L0FR13_9EUKA|nr:hypothetical protein SARC_08473 [Sphaeroforma arctica JP610]KNC79124.1 hypothetical protein SARC_08473 [Sphaeroforma arctica JP610]|eukprot:XP_014153026.1 hypothetical protein SARC_08473 [Sphaeroforma arctica JP610]
MNEDTHTAIAQRLQGHFKFKKNSIVQATQFRPTALQGLPHKAPTREDIKSRIHHRPTRQRAPCQNQYIDRENQETGNVIDAEQRQAVIIGLVVEIIQDFNITLELKKIRV